ncbi:Metallo-dependent phosphatase-like protein [Mycena floridula]|nr:Metallo-dependent phosphatase-like protein [Mycena floridula]
MGTLLFFLIQFVAAVHGCGDHDHLVKRATTVPLIPPSRPLEWADLNFIHTTDSHGWLLGHSKTSFPEPNYSGTLGDFASFVAHMKQTALEKDVDLLLVDSGDLHDGTGLTDAFPPGSVDGHDALQYVKEIDYDVMAIGNHELYLYNVTLDMHTTFAPALKGRYLTSNVNITYVDEHGNVVNTPVGNRFTKFKTRKGRNVTALGVLFHFTGNDTNTTVQTVADMVKESWFIEAIREEPDFFLLAGHMDLVDNDWVLVSNAIRAIHPHTAILVFGGHSHIRNCLQLDPRSVSFQSGRYMETVGWMSANIGPKGSDKNITFSRRYLDPNRVTYEYHTGRHGATFDTPQGKTITAGLQAIAIKYDINHVYGTAPQDYTFSRAPFGSNGSLLTLLGEQVAPVALAINNSRALIPNIIIINTGSQRFDIYKGPFTTNDQYTLSPHLNGFMYIPSVPFSIAKLVYPTLNEQGELRRRELDELRYAQGDVDKEFRDWLADMDILHGGEQKREANNLTLGYVTKDSCPGVGDDIPHAPLASFPVPAFTASKYPDVSDDTLIDLVFDDNLEEQLIALMNSLQDEETYTVGSNAYYSPILVNSIWEVFAAAAWN